MKQIVDKLNNIAKAIDENVELPTTDLIIDSLDAITRAFGGEPSGSKLIVDKLEDIEEVAHGGITPTGNIAITENTAEPLDIAQYATATVNVSGGGGDNLIKCVVTLINESGNKRQFGANTLAILNEDGIIDLHTPVLDANETKIITLLLLTDAGDRIFCVVTDGAITTSNENDCLITDNCLYPSDETVTECSITIALKS